HTLVILTWYTTYGYKVDDNKAQTKKYTYGNEKVIHIKESIHLKKSVLTIGTVAVVTLGSTIFADTSVSAEKPLDDIKDERQELKADLSKAESNIDDIMIDVEEQNQKIDRVESSIKENKEKVTANEEKIEEYQTEIEELETEIAEIEEVMEERAETLKERLAAYQ